MGLKKRFNWLYELNLNVSKSSKINLYYLFLVFDCYVHVVIFLFDFWLRFRLDVLKQVKIHRSILCPALLRHNLLFFRLRFFLIDTLLFLTLFIYLGISKLFILLCVFISSFLNRGTRELVWVQTKFVTVGCFCKFKGFDQVLNFVFNAFNSFLDVDNFDC